MKRFKIIETNLTNLTESHFHSDTPLRSQTFHNYEVKVISSASDRGLLNTE